MLLFLSGKTCSQHDTWNNISFIRCYAPCGADGLIARVKRLDRTRNTPARDQTRRTRTRILRALTHAQTRHTYTHTHTYTYTHTHLSVQTALRDDTLWNLIPRHRLQVSYIFLFFFFHSSSLGSIFFLQKKNTTYTIIINYNTPYTHL